MAVSYLTLAGAAVDPERLTVTVADPAPSSTKNVLDAKPIVDDTTESSSTMMTCEKDGEPLVPPVTPEI